MWHLAGANSFSDGTARVKEEVGAGTGSSFESLENLEGLALGLGRRSWLGIPEQFHHQHRRMIAKHDPGPPRLVSPTNIRILYPKTLCVCKFNLINWFRLNGTNLYPFRERKSLKRKKNQSCIAFCSESCIQNKFIIKKTVQALGVI